MNIKKFITKQVKKVMVFICLFVSTMTAVKAEEFSDDRALFSDSPTDIIDINGDDMFMKQTSRGTCTLLSNTMMLKRRAALDNTDYWDTISEGTVRKTAWLNGVGIRNEFTYEDYKVVYRSLSGSAQEKKEQLIELLEEHPEGIAAYDRNLPHAILLSDYSQEEDMFYCSDPANYYPEGRYSILLSYLGEKRGSDQIKIIENISNYWCIEE